MTVLVTGAGVIGCLTAEMLAARREAVVLIDIVPPAACPGGTEFETCDITDLAALARVIARHRVDRIVHTAAMLSTGIRQDPVRGVSVNVIGTTNVLECARQVGLRRVVCASSTTVAYAVFGGHGPAPVMEDEPIKLVSQRPASIYAATKIASEHLALLYRDLYGLDVVCLRYGAVIGGSLEAPTSVPGKLLMRLAEGGRTGRRVTLDDPLLLWGGKEEFVDARDCAGANLCALDAPSPQQGVYNIATGEWFSLPEFIAAVGSVFPAIEVDHPLDIESGFAGFPAKRPAPSSIVAAREELGFLARYGLAISVSHWISAAPSQSG
jgi:UDP-glucose 4-epimerase